MVTMTDTFSKQKRSQIMKCILGKDTAPELKVRSFLHRHGIRFRLHAVKLPGKPDIVIKKFNTVIFVHGCFWHQHKDTRCKRASVPKSNLEYWLPKFDRTIIRDAANQDALIQKGWKVRVIWECQVTEKGLSELLRDIKQ